MSELEPSPPAAPVVRAGTVLDVETVAAVREQLMDLVTAGHTRIVLDLKDTTFIDSTGLGAIVSVLKAMESSRGRLSVVNAAPSVERIFGITGLGHFLGEGTGRG